METLFFVFAEKLKWTILFCLHIPSNAQPASIVSDAPGVCANTGRYIVVSQTTTVFEVYLDTFGRPPHEQ